MGMAGTFISAALLLLRQDWRASVNRFAEAMTVFAVSVSGLFPILHLGRPWFFYWVAPYPNAMGTWPQWRSSLTWDFFAISAYLIVSILYWYLGMLPDLATLRDAATKPPALFLRIPRPRLARRRAAMARARDRRATARRHRRAARVFRAHDGRAGFLAGASCPGWHSSLFGPFFVGGALFSGFAMTLVLAIMLRRAFALDRLITDGDLDRLAKLLLAVGVFVAYCYAVEMFMPFYSGNAQEIATTTARFHGPYAWVYWLT